MVVVIVTKIVTALLIVSAVGVGEQDGSSSDVETVIREHGGEDEDESKPLGFIHHEKTIHRPCENLPGGCAPKKTTVVKKVVVTKTEKAVQERSFWAMMSRYKDGVPGMPQGCITKGMAEGIGMMLLVFIGAGSGMANPDHGHKILHTSLVRGFAQCSLLYAIGHYSGGHLNPAVTFGLFLVGQFGAGQGLIIVAFQTLGAFLGAAILSMIFDEHTDETRPNYLGTNFIRGGFQWWQAFYGEVMMTFFIVYVYMETVVCPENAAIQPEAGLAIGFSVFVAHSVLLPIDGCSTNPARSFGPLIARKLFREGGKQAYLSQYWIFTFAPLLGSFLAAGIYLCMNQKEWSNYVAEQ